MLTIVIQVAAPDGAAQGIKEALAMALEEYGDTRVISIKEQTSEQLSLYRSR